MLAEEIFQEAIMDNYRNPKNFGKLDNPEIKFKDSNPACADIIEIQIKTKDNKINEIKFSGGGCAISMASASMLTESVKGKNLKEIKRLSREDIISMLNIPLSGIRTKCAMLPLKVLKFGVYEYLGSKYDDDN